MIGEILELGLTSALLETRQKRAIEGLDCKGTESKTGHRGA